MYKIEKVNFFNNEINRNFSLTDTIALTHLHWHAINKVKNEHKKAD